MSGVRTTARRAAWGVWATWRGRADVWTLLLPACVAMAAGMPQLFESRWRGNLAYYGGITLKATREGYWWSLREGDVWFFNKPPLGYWIHALWVMVFGESAWSLRGPSLVAVMALALLTSWLVRVGLGVNVRGSRLAGIAAGMAVAMNPEVISAIGKFRLDIMHTVCLVIAAAAIVASAEAKTKSARLWIVAGIGIGAGLMIKPLFALAVPVVVVLSVACANSAVGGVRESVRRAGIAGALACVAGVGIASIWHVAMTAQHGRVFWDAYLFAQSIDRATGAKFEGEPWWWYLAHLVRDERGRASWGTIAAATATVGGVIATLRLVRRVRSSGDEEHHKLNDGRITHRSAMRLGVHGAVWCGVWLLMLSVFADKRDYYFVVVVPGMGVLTGVLVWALLSGVDSHRATAGSERGRFDAVAMASGVACCCLLLSAAVSGVRGTAAQRDGANRWAIERDLRMMGQGLIERGVSGVYNGGMRYYDSALLYIVSGIWPRTAVEKAPVDRVHIPHGAIAVYDVSPSREGQQGRPRLDQRDERLLRIGRYVAVRRAERVSRETVDE